MSISRASMMSYCRAINCQSLSLLAGAWLLACLPALANPRNVQFQEPVLLSQRSDDVTLQYGSSGPQVEELQRALNRNGLFPHPIDGVYGDDTRQAVRQFQRINRLDVTGQADAATLSALDIDPDVLLPLMVHPIHGSISVDRLQLGDRSRDVTTLQNVLNSFGFGLPTTGFYGDQTRQAVRAYQRTAGIEDSRGNVSGIADRATLIHMGFEPTGRVDRDNSFVAAIIAGASELNRVRRDFPEAVVVDDGRLGNYIDVGRYARHSQADDRVDEARALGYDARVIKD